MRVNGQPWRTITLAEDGVSVCVIDQTRLPDAFETVTLRTLDEAAHAIRTMIVRGAPLIGVTAAYGLALAMRTDASDAALAAATSQLAATRPTAINLRWALDRMQAALAPLAPSARAEAAYGLAARLADDDVEACRRIGEHGARVLRSGWEAGGSRSPLQVLTHCNAGWLATVDWGTALAPIYRLHDEGVPVHVWVDETRPRNQGLLTAWELGQHGVPCTLVVDNAGGLLMQRGQVDACIVGSDRTVRNGDVCNKVGTHLKALAARDAGIPFYVALPSSTFDFRVASGDAIPIEERASTEITTLPWLRVHNPAFDVTPARLVTALITERGVCAATPAALAAAFPDLAAAARWSEASA
jgi:methylthioribose-1-phosphate isomerase